MILLRMTLRKTHVKSSLKKILMIGFLSSGLSALSQEKPIPNIGNWTMFFGQLRFHDKWSIHAEAQNRDFGIISEPEQIYYAVALTIIFPKMQ